MINPTRSERITIILQERHSTFVFWLTQTCGNCGAENREEANYCLKCGQSVSTPRAEVMTIAPAPASPSVVWGPPPVRKCLFHPTLLSNFNCAGCGAPICFACAGGYYGAMFCPICYSSRIGTGVSKTQLAYFVPFAPTLVYGVRSVRWIALT